VDPIQWLLESDPAIRWQTMRDLTDGSSEAVAAERRRVPLEGVGAKILACQGSDGSWHRAGDPDWLPTLFTMQLLRATGVEKTEPAVEAAVSRLETGFRWDEAFGAKPFFEGEVEPCINGQVIQWITQILRNRCAPFRLCPRHVLRCASRISLR